MTNEEAMTVLRGLLDRAKKQHTTKRAKMQRMLDAGKTPSASMRVDVERAEYTVQQATAAVGHLYALLDAPAADSEHWCSYECERPACIRAQRDELASRLTAPPPAAAEQKPVGEVNARAGVKWYSRSVPATGTLLYTAPPAAARGDVRGLVAKWRAEAGSMESLHRKQTGYEVDWSFRAKEEALDYCADELEAAIAAEGVQAGYDTPPDWYARREQHAREMGYTGLADALADLERRRSEGVQPAAQQQGQADEEAAAYEQAHRAGESHGRIMAALEQSMQQGGGEVCETCDGAGHVVTYADPYDRGDVSSPEQSPCPDCAEGVQAGEVSSYDLAVLDDAAETLDRIGEGSAGLRDARARIASALSQQPEATLLREQPCGCVLCVCEDERQCHGCGARHCGNFTDHPVYVAQQPEARGVVDVEAIRSLAADMMAVVSEVDDIGALGSHVVAFVNRLNALTGERNG